MQNAAPQQGKRHFNKKSCTPTVQDSAKKKQCLYSGKSNKAKRYPHSDGSINLREPCPYCGYSHGLKLIRFKDSEGFCKCGRCDAALFSIAEAKTKQGLTHIGTVLDNYRTTPAAFDGEVAK